MRTAEQQRRPALRKDAPTKDAKHTAIVTLLATVIGGLLAIAGSLATVWWQSRADIELRASAVAADYTEQGIAVRATFTNEGMSGATVHDMRLELDGRLVAKAEGTVSELARLRESLPFRANVGAYLGPDTFSVSSRSTTTVGIVFKAPSRCRKLPATVTERTAKAMFTCLLLDCQPARKRCPSGHRPELVLRTSPGGERRTPVDIGSPRRRSFTSWEPLVRRRGSFTALGVERQGPGKATATDLVQLRLWRLDRARPPLTVERPVIGPARTWFPLPELKRGLYAWAFTTDERPFLAGFLRICRGDCKALYGIRGRLWKPAEKPAVPRPAPVSPHKIAPPAAVVPECADAIDNDGDGLLDLVDPGCVDEADAAELDASLPPPGSAEPGGEAGD